MTATDKLGLTTGRVKPRVMNALAAAGAAIVVAVIGDTVVSLLARHVFGAPSGFPPLHPAPYISLTILGLLAGTLGWYMIVRVIRDPTRLLRVLVPVILVLSFIPDIAVGVSKSMVHTTWGGVAALMVMHVVVAAVGVISYRRFMPPTAR